MRAVVLDRKRLEWIGAVSLMNTAGKVGCEGLRWLSMQLSENTRRTGLKTDVDSGL